MRVTVDPSLSETYVNPPETVLLGSVNEPHGNGTATSCQAGTDCIPIDSVGHGVGDIVFAGDKTMYVSIGDGSDPFIEDSRSFRSQYIDWLSGKILHIDRDGRGLPSNPFYNGDPDAPRSKVYQLGLRYPYRITFDAAGRLYAADVGNRLWEELNQGPPGSNFGWPCFEGNSTFLSAEVCVLIANKSVAPKYSYQWTKPGVAIIGGAFYNGNSYPAEYRGNYFFADYVREAVWRLSFGSEEGKVSVHDVHEAKKPVSVFSFSNGDIGWTSFEGDIFRLSYVRDNAPPDAHAFANVTSGPVPLAVQFMGDESFDPEGARLSYIWDFGDGEASHEATPIHTFTESGRKTVTLTVSDGSFDASEKIEIHAGNRPPEIVIIKPLDGTVFAPGEDINYLAMVRDPEDGPIPAGEVEWKLMNHHGEHIHEVFENTGIVGSFPLDNHGDDSAYEIEVKATDSEGLTATASVRFSVSSSQ